MRRRVKLIDDSADDSPSSSRTSNVRSQPTRQVRSRPTLDKRRKVSPDQWLEIQQRIIAGEKPSAFADEYGVSAAHIYQRCVSGGENQVRADNTRKLAASMAKSETAFAALPIVEQVMVRTLADHLKNISHNLAGAANFGARNAHRLSAIAHECIEGLQPLHEDQSGDEAVDTHIRNSNLMTSAMHATAGANEAAKIGLNLLSANKDMLKDLDNGKVIDITPHLIKDDDPVAASATYQRLVAGGR